MEKEKKRKRKSRLYYLVLAEIMLVLGSVSAFLYYKQKADKLQGVNDNLREENRALLKDNANKCRHITRLHERLKSTNKQW